MSHPADEAAPTESLEVHATVTLFGFDSTPATVRLAPRSRSWRLGGTIRTVVITLILAPAVVVIPPHVPWALGVLATGFVLARRRWTHRFTLEGLEATCPRCGSPLEAAPGRLRVPQPVTCSECGHDASIEIDADALAAAEI